MSDKIPPIPKGLEITPEQVEAISGGGCTPEELGVFVANLKQTYEGLIDFTTYLIERVAGTPQ